MEKEQFLTKLFNIFLRKNIQYFIFGPYQELPRDTGGSDIDMVIFQGDAKKVDTIIRNLIADFGLVLASYYENTMTKFYRVLSCSWGVQLDVFFKGFYCRGYEYFPINSLHCDIILYNGIKVLRLDKGYYVDFFKEVVHTGTVKQKYITGFIDWYSQHTLQCDCEIRSYYGDRVADILSESLTSSELSSKTNTLKLLIHDNLKKGHSVEMFNEIINKFFRLFCKRPGYVIVVEGTDGSGKSTLINGITPILNEAFHNSVIYNHLRPNAIPDLGVLLGKKSSQEKNCVNSNPHGQRQSGFIGSLFRWSYYLVDYTFGYFKIVWLQIHSKSKVFIFDRYYYDYYFDQKRSKTVLPKWIIRFGEFFIPKPDLVLCLGGNPATIFARKQETSLEEVSTQTIKLKTFCQTHKHTVWVDTTASIENSIETSMVAICKMMSNRNY